MNLLQQWLAAKAALLEQSYGDTALQAEDFAPLKAIEAQLDTAGVSQVERDAAYAGRFGDDVRLNRRYRA